MDSARVPKLASLQHVIGHKKLQLCINLLRFCLHWHCHCPSSDQEEGWRIEWNRIASHRIEWKRSQAKGIESSGGRDWDRRMANGWRGQQGQHRHQHRHRHGALITTCHQILMSNPLASSSSSSSSSCSSTRVGTTTSNKCCKRCKHNNL